MENENSAIVEKLRNYFNECGLSDSSSGYILLLKAIICRMDNPCMPLNDLYGVLAKEYNCSCGAVKNAIFNTISAANKLRTKKGEERLTANKFITTCVNRYSDVEL